MKKLCGILITGIVISTTLSAQTPITSDNVNNYAPTFTGGGASGTWPINITGAATGLYGYTGSYVVYWGWDASGKLRAKISGSDYGTNVPMNITGFATSETLQSITTRGNTTSSQLSVFTNNGADFTYIGGNAAYARIGAHNNTTGPKNLIINEAGGYVGVGTIAPAYKLHVNGDVGISSNLTLLGNQKIGTTENQKNLDVNGIIKTRKVKVTATEWPDYVFDSSYLLKPLNQVETYIQQHKHLPEIPSAEKIKKEGADLGDTQVLLLKKIEELTLYIIQQNKNIATQQKELEAMKKRIAELEKK